MPTRHAIYAQSRAGHIGRKGNHPLLWKLKGDLPRFKAMTNGAAIIMGRYTHESLPGLLPDRFHIVVSRTLPEGLDLAMGIAWVGSLDAAFTMATSFGYEDQFVIGGGELIDQAIPYCHKVHRTLVFDADGDLTDMVMVTRPGRPPYWGRFELESVENGESVDGKPTHWYETYQQQQPKEPNKV